MEEIKKILGMSYEEFKQSAIESFKEYLEGELIEESEVTYKNISNYLACMHFDIIDEVESIEDKLYIEEIIEKILRERFLKKVNKILLYDNSTKEAFDHCDIVKFKEDYYLKDIKKVIQEFKEKDLKENGSYTYTKLDIFDCLSSKFFIKSVEHLSDIDMVDY